MQAVANPRPAGRTFAALALTAAAGGVALLGAGMWVLHRASPPPPPVLSSLPAYTLVDQDGRSFGSEQLKGHPYVADFIYTRCPTVCPRMTDQMAELAGRLLGAPQIHLVSFSADPGFDTPARLKAYALSHRADLTRWTFLTGDERQIADAAIQGFKLAYSPARDAADFGSIIHGRHFVLVDGAGRIRGYYDPTTPGALDHLAADARRLLGG